MRIRDSLAALVLLALGVVGEWVPVAVIDRGPEARRPQGPQRPLGPQGPPVTHGSQGLQDPQSPQGPEDSPWSHGSQTPTTPPSLQPLPDEPIGPPGPQDDVITIRRTVGDSFSNKQGVVVPPVQDHSVGSAGAAAAGPQNREDDDGVHVEDDVLETREDPADVPVPKEEEDEAAAGGLPLEELREAHRALLKQSTAPVSGKLDYLRRLKNRLLRHIAALVPQTVQSLAARTGAPTAAEGRGHKGLGFPSNEGTLMSLAFLVFAVFLVKVVLQLIYAVQNSQANNAAGVRVAQMQLPTPMMPAAVGSMMGTMMNMVPAMMPPMMGAMEPAMAMRGRARRDAEGLHRITADVMDAIDRARGRLAGMGAG